MVQSCILLRRVPSNHDLIDKYEAVGCLPADIDAITERHFTFSDKRYRVCVVVGDIPITQDDARGAAECWRSNGWECFITWPRYNREGVELWSNRKMTSAQKKASKKSESPQKSARQLSREASESYRQAKQFD